MNKKAKPHVAWLGTQTKRTIFQNPKQVGSIGNLEQQLFETWDKPRYNETNLGMKESERDISKTEFEKETHPNTLNHSVLCNNPKHTNPPIYPPIHPPIRVAYSDKRNTSSEGNLCLFIIAQAQPCFFTKCECLFFSVVFEF